MPFYIQLAGGIRKRRHTAQITGRADRVKTLWGGRHVLHARKCLWSYEQRTEYNFGSGGSLGGRTSPVLLPRPFRSEDIELVLPLGAVVGTEDQGLAIEREFGK
jgi:hypothetical protein